MPFTKFVIDNDDKLYLKTNTITLKVMVKNPIQD